MNYFVYKVESICETCRLTQPNLYGISRCQNLRVLKHRMLNDKETFSFIRNNPKMYTIERICDNMPYEDAYTIFCFYSA